MSESSEDLVILLCNILIIVFTTFCIIKVRIRHPTYVFVMMCTFSLGIVISLLVLIWAHETGAIDEQGQYAGEFGKIVRLIVDYSTEIEFELLTVGILLSVLAITQIISYVLSGIFGCSLSPLLLRQGSTAAMWFVIKSFAFTSGFILIIGPAGLLFRWKNFSKSSVELTTFSSFMLITCAFFKLFIYVEIKHSIKEIFRNPNSLVKKLHKFATRFNIIKNKVTD